MPAKKTVPPAPQHSLPDTESQTSVHSTSTGRKPWVKRTPIDVVLGEIGKQEERVQGMREELAKEERELKKLQQAKNVLEST
jgi:hypothetical protein